MLRNFKKMTCVRGGGGSWNSDEGGGGSNHTKKYLRNLWTPP